MQNTRIMIIQERDGVVNTYVAGGNNIAEYTKGLEHLMALGDGEHRYYKDASKLLYEALRGIKSEVAFTELPDDALKLLKLQRIDLSAVDSLRKIECTCGRNSIFALWMIYQYGMIEGKRAERAKKKLRSNLAIAH